MSRNISKPNESTLFKANIYLHEEDWTLTKKLAKKKNLSGADLVRQWMREGLERSKK